MLNLNKLIGTFYLTLACATIPLFAQTTLDGVFTEAQAARGAKAYIKYCSQCHDIAYFQNVFLRSWKNQPVNALYDVIRNSMPEDRPGALKPRQYADLIAYLFELNNLPAGESKLDHKNDAMQQITIQLPPPGEPHE